ncbi:serine/threonine kinase (plasmid) [Nostoc sp. HK-01]|nr:serine/threonine kinase [Nostoc sp. HK-01]
MDEVVKKVAALSLPIIILVVTMATTGFTGASAITAALAFLGGPTGMLGGIAVLELTGLITDALAKVILEGFLTSIYSQRRQTEAHTKLLKEIDFLLLFDHYLKERLKATVKTHTVNVTKEVMAILENVPGMTRAYHRDFKSSNPIMKLRDGTVVRTWKNPVGVDHVFLGDRNDKMIYGGFVGWIHSEGLQQALTRIRRDFT